METFDDAKPPMSKKKKIWIAIGVACVPLWLIGSYTTDSNGNFIARKDGNSQLECGHGWAGQNWAFERAVKENLKDPGSYEHIESKFGVPDAEGNQIATLKYRARNGFGGMEIANAEGVLNVNDCLESFVMTNMGNN